MSRLSCTESTIKNFELLSCNVWGLGRSFVWVCGSKTHVDHEAQCKKAKTRLDAIGNLDLCAALVTYRLLMPGMFCFNR